MLSSVSRELCVIIEMSGLIAALLFLIQNGQDIHS